MVTGIFILNQLWFGLIFEYQTIFFNLNQKKYGLNEFKRNQLNLLESHLIDRLIIVAPRFETYRLRDQYGQLPWINSELKNQELLIVLTNYRSV